MNQENNPSVGCCDEEESFLLGAGSCCGFRDGTKFSHLSFQIMRFFCCYSGGAGGAAGGEAAAEEEKAEEEEMEAPAVDMFGGDGGEHTHNRKYLMLDSFC